METDKIEKHNLKEEIKEIVGNALKKGISNDSCAIFRVMREEQYSPKGKALILNNDFYDKTIYYCNLCKACEKPIFNSRLCEAFLKARQLLVLQKKEPKKVKEMIENLIKTGNIFGVTE